MTPPDEGMNGNRPGGVPIDKCRQELENLLTSGIARGHTHLHDLLTYLGGRALENPAKPLKEYVIGIEALHKPAQYDPRLDPTVRVEVAKLRKKLDEYYRGPGAGHPVKMVIPRGGYLPAFHTEAPPVTSPGRWRSLAVAAVAFAALALVLLMRSYANPQTSGDLDLFWKPWLSDATPTVLVYGTPLFVKMNRSFYRDPRINSPQEAVEEGRLGRVLRALEPDEKRPVFTFTGAGEAKAVFLLTRILAPLGASLDAQPSSSLTWDSLKRKNVIFLGGRKYNPMIPDLPHKPRFEAVSRAIVDLHPSGNQPVEYRTASKTPHGEITQEYALISVYPGLSDGTRLMILDSSSTEGTLAAAEFITRADTIRELARHKVPLGAGKNLLRPFQVVVAARFNQGVPVTLVYVTHAELT